jgi:hypothetical protein
MSVYAQGHLDGSMAIKLSEMKQQQVSAEFVTVSQLNNPQQGRTVVKYVQRQLIYVDPVILHYC